MKALTLWRPWPWAIFHAPYRPKRLENRGWPPPRYIIGKQIALHAGKSFDKDSVDVILDLTTPEDQSSLRRVLPASATDEGLIGVVTVKGFLTNPAELQEVEQAEWFCGPFAWVLTDVRPFMEPIRIKGAQGLWDLPSWAEARVREELRP